MPDRFCCLFGLVIGLVAVIYAPARAQQGTPLRVNIGVDSANNIPFMVALEEGIYKKNGLDVDQFVLATMAESAKEEGYLIPPQYIGKDETPPPIRSGNGVGRMLARGKPKEPADEVVILTLEPEVRAHIVAGPGIHSVEQLKGKRLGITTVGFVTHFEALFFAERMGWDPVRDITLVPRAASPEALKEGRVDAYIANGFRFAGATAEGIHSILDLRSWKLPLHGTGMFASQSWLRDNRETARRFVQSLVEAIAVTKKDKKAAFRAMNKWWGLTDTKKMETLYAAAREVPAKPYPSLEGIQKAMQLYASDQMRKYKPEDFYDDSFVRELDQSGLIDRLYK